MPKTEPANPDSDSDWDTIPEVYTNEVAPAKSKTNPSRDTIPQPSTSDPSANTQINSLFPDDSPPSSPDNISILSDSMEVPLSGAESDDSKEFFTGPYRRRTFAPNGKNTEANGGVKGSGDEGEETGWGDENNVDISGCVQRGAGGCAC